jgi:hypothetical protein
LGVKTTTVIGNTVRESRLAPNIGLETIQFGARSGGHEDDI